MPQHAAACRSMPQHKKFFRGTALACLGPIFGMRDTRQIICLMGHEMACMVPTREGCLSYLPNTHRWSVVNTCYAHSRVAKKCAKTNGEPHLPEETTDIIIPLLTPPAPHIPKPPHATGVGVVNIPSPPCPPCL